MNFGPKCVYFPIGNAVSGSNSDLMPTEYRISYLVPLMQPISDMLFLDFEEMIYILIPIGQFYGNGFKNGNQTKCLFFGNFPMRFPIGNQPLYSKIFIFFQF